MSTPASGLRTAVIGTAGTGKTTLAERLARRLGVPHVELDALYWGPHWTPSEPDAFRARVEQALSAEMWVADGNYSVVRDFVWSRATTLVWLDYSLFVVLYRLIRRTIGRVWSGTELWNGNRETLRNAFFGEEPLFVWVIRDHHPRRRRFEAALQQPAYAHLRVIRLRSPQHAEQWLRSISSFELAR